MRQERSRPVPRFPPVSGSRPVSSWCAAKHTTPCRHRHLGLARLSAPAWLGVYGSRAWAQGDRNWGRPDARPCRHENWCGVAPCSGREIPQRIDAPTAHLITPTRFGPTAYFILLRQRRILSHYARVLIHDAGLGVVGQHARPASCASGSTTVFNGVTTRRRRLTSIIFEPA